MGLQIMKERIHHVGHSFAKSIELDLFPHMKFRQGYYSCRIDWECQSDIFTEFNSTEFNGGEKVIIRVGSDVRAINVRFNCHNSFPQNPMVNAGYTMRVDRLILLNLACKLIESKKFLPAP